MTKGIIVGGDLSTILVRQKGDARLEVGELLVAQQDDEKMLLQVNDLRYGSQVSAAHLELMAGLQLEEQTLLHDEHLRNYVVVQLQALLLLRQGSVSKAKSLPSFFSAVRAPRPDDFSFLGKPDHPLFLGQLRSGSRTLDLPVYVNGKDAFAHHVLIAATTGRGKSNLLKCLLWDLVEERYCGTLVLDPHDEYWRQALSLHSERSRVHHYCIDPQAGSSTLRFNLNLLRPHHFHGVIDWTDAQRQAVAQYWRDFEDSWIAAIVREEVPRGSFLEGTLAVVRRRLLQVLELEQREGSITSDGIFVPAGGETTLADICRHLEAGETVVIDTSAVEGAVEILIGSMVATEMLRRYKRHNLEGTIQEKPVISIILEEAPRVLGKEVLERGPNIFATIAREGRKFRIGLLAITQLPSLIPREILANMNTKIIMGMEMKTERQALIESASQDLSNDDRAIASLDRGEAIITSTFVPFALPIRVPRFEEFRARPEVRKSYAGLKPD